MSLNLKKGQKIDLTKTNPGLSQILAGLGWNPRVTDGKDFDLDASAFLVGENGKCASEEDFIFYKQSQHASGAVVHTGDNRTGDGAGDDEQILVNLAAVPANIQKIVFTVTIDEAEARGQNFGQVEDAYIRIVNSEGDVELNKFDLSEDASIETALIAAELYRHGTEWKFAAVGQGFAGGLAALCRHFGLDVE